MSEVRLGIDVACRADHRASLADERGEFLWSSWKFRTTTTDLERLWAKIPDDASVPGGHRALQAFGRPHGGSLVGGVEEELIERGVPLVVALIRHLRHVGTRVSLHRPATVGSPSPQGADRGVPPLRSGFRP